MSKAVFAMDMPKNCMECMFCFEIDEGIEACCTITVEPDDEDLCRDIEEYYCQCKPDWCPLKPIPEKRERSNVPNNYDGGYSHGYVAGWNACIDAICGEE